VIEVGDEDMARRVPVSPIEPVKGSWKNSTYWGNKFEGPMPAAEGQVISLYSGEKIPGPPRVQTIILGRDIAAPVGTNADFRAVIAYGVGAANNSFECDWGRGMQIPIVANWIQVNALTYRPASNLAYDAAGGRVSITAGHAEGALTPGTPVSLTVPAVTIANLALSAFIAPEFAKGAVVNAIGASVATAIPVGLTVGMSSGATVLGRYAYEDIIAAGFPLLGGADRITVLNNTGGDLLVTVQWILGL